MKPEIQAPPRETMTRGIQERAENVNTQIARIRDCLNEVVDALLPGEPKAEASGRSQPAPLPMGWGENMISLLDNADILLNQAEYALARLRDRFI